MNALKKISLIGIVISIIGIVGTMDYNDHVQMERYKCERGGSAWVVETNGDQYCK